MNSLKRLHRLNDMETFQHNLDSLLRHSTNLPHGVQPKPAAAPEWSPLVDISEDEREYLIKAELPEVKKEDVKVTAEAGTLTIMGERKFENGEHGKKSIKNVLPKAPLIKLRSMCKPLLSKRNK